MDLVDPIFSFRFKMHELEIVGKNVSKNMKKQIKKAPCYGAFFICFFLGAKFDYWDKLIPHLEQA